MASRAPATASPAPAEAVAAPTPSRHFESPRVRTSLKVSSPGDPAEREAEATARRVVAMPVPIRPRPIGPMARQAARAPAIPVPRPTMPGPTPSPEEKEMGPEMAAAIKGRLGGGRPLPREAARFMEPRFGADFGGVRVHDDGRAANLATRLGARAFTLGRDIFFNRGEFQPEARSGKELLAHELTHTIQQGGAAQRGVVQREADPAAPVTVKEASGPIVQRGIKDRALAWIGDKANMIPGFRLFTIVIGVNPITGAGVEPSGANILRALVEFLPGGGLVTQALDRYSVFEKVGSWVEQQFRTLGMVGGMFIDALKNFIGSLELGDITDPGGVIDRGIRIFTEPVKRLIDFAKSLGAGILKFIREAILKPLAALAEGTAGYDLLKAVLGEDPVTGEAVTPTPDLVIGGFMKLIGQQEIWENIKKANAIARAWQWFKDAIAGLKALVASIPKRFMDTLKSLEIMDLVLPPLAFAKVGKAFASFMGDFMSWGLGTVLQLLQIIFEVVAPAAVPYVKKAGGAFNTILKNPIGFVGTLVAAGKLGFSQFRGNFLKHLQAALVGWLTGTMSGAGVYIPQGFSVPEILKFVLSVLGLTWANIRAKLVKAIGDPAVKMLEDTFAIVKTLVTQGPAAAWQQILESLTNLKEMVIESIKDYVKSKVVEIAVTKLLSMLSPAGAFIQAIIAIYNTIMFFIERIRQIAAVAASFIDSIAAIAAGTIAPAASRVEKTMAGMLTLVISFLARFAGLGKVSDAVLKLIAKVRAPIDKGLDKVVTWIVAQAKKLGKFIAQAGVPQDPKQRLKLGMQASVALIKGRKGLVLSEGVITGLLTAIKTRYGFIELVGFKRANRWWVRGRTNPPDEVPVSEEKKDLAKAVREIADQEVKAIKPGAVKGTGTHEDPYVVPPAGGIAAIAAHMETVQLGVGKVAVYDVSPSPQSPMRGTWQRPPFGGDAIISGATTTEKRIDVGKYTDIVAEIKARFGDDPAAIAKIQKIIAGGEVPKDMREHIGWLGGLKTLAAKEVHRDPVAAFTIPATMELAGSGIITPKQAFVHAGPMRTRTESAGGLLSHSPVGAKAALRGARESLGMTVPETAPKTRGSKGEQKGVILADVETVVRLSMSRLKTKHEPPPDEIKDVVRQAVKLTIK